MRERDSSPSIFVVCWTAGAAQGFTCSTDWGGARDAFEQLARPLLSDAGRSLSEVRANYGQFHEAGGRTRVTGTFEAGLFRAHTVDPQVDSGAFVYFEPGAQIPFAGSPKSVEELIVRVEARRPGLRPLRHLLAELYQPPRPTPVSEARATRRVRALLENTSDAPLRTQAMLGQLNHGELLWLGHKAREQGAGSLAHAAGRSAYELKRSPGSVNLLAATARDRGFFDRSVDFYRESILLEPSPERNPYAFIGLAATLRRLWRLEDAYDELKRVGRWYPDDRYLLETFDAVRRDLQLPIRADRGMRRGALRPVEAGTAIH